jgi:CRISPR-associated endonuclease/helicase Cas3
VAHMEIRRIVSAKKRIERAAVFEPREVAALARERHRAGTRTIVIVNRVLRAQEIYRYLKREGGEAEVVLLHSRFRPPDRAAHVAALLSQIDPAGPGRIVVATQVVEAGIDVSSSTLITDIAPWPSLIQRFGRCNRKGQDADARCIWLDAGDSKKDDVRPYEFEDLTASRDLLREHEGASAAPIDLPRRPIPLRTGLVIRRPEFFDLFDTSPDLSGHDVDVSPYIRDADDNSVFVFWRNDPPSVADVPHRDELCSAPAWQVRELLKVLRSAGNGAGICIANQFASDADRAWTKLHDSEVRPGLVVWLRSDLGWYDGEFGFSKTQQQHVLPVGRQPVPEPSENCPVTDSDLLSQIGIPITLARHAQDAQRYARDLAKALAFPRLEITLVETAALWHDVGKAHAVFQETMQRANAGIANGPAIWAKGVRRVQHQRRGFRHELPGALAYLKAHDGEPGADLVAYLIAAHHGKMRVTTHQLPFEAQLDPFQMLGVREGERLPEVDLGSAVSPATTLSLGAFRIGSTNGERTWVDRTTSLRDDPATGPFRLAYLELLVRLADWRASAEEMQCK